MALSPAARADFADGLAAYDAGDYETAHEEWEPLAAAGDANALTALAGLYSDGNGVPRDFATAAALYRRAAERGDMIAPLSLGDLYRNGPGVVRDVIEAYVWFSRAAVQGSEWAAEQLAQLSANMSAGDLAEAERRLAAGD